MFLISHFRALSDVRPTYAVDEPSHVAFGDDHGVVVPGAEVCFVVSVNVAAAVANARAT